MNDWELNVDFDGAIIIISTPMFPLFKNGSTGICKLCFVTILPNVFVYLNGYFNCLMNKSK